MPITEFYELWFFDTFIEPQGPVMDDYYHAREIFTQHFNHPYQTKEARQKLNIKDFMRISEKVFKSAEELEQERIEAEEAEREKMLSMFDPELIKKAKKRMKNG